MKAFKYIFFVLAVIAGITMALQGSLNSALGKITGLLEATLVVHITGTVVALILLLMPIVPKGELIKLFSAPWYLWTGGLLGVLIVYGVVATIPQLGVANATALIIIGQVTTALIIDHFGLFGLSKISFNWIKLLGVGLLAAGAKIMLN